MESVNLPMALAKAGKIDVRGNLRTLPDPADPPPLSHTPQLYNNGWLSSSSGLFLNFPD